MEALTLKMDCHAEIFSMNIFRSLYFPFLALAKISLISSLAWMAVWWNMVAALGSQLWHWVQWTVLVRESRKWPTFFSSTHGTFSRVDHMLGHKTSLNKFKKTEMISSIFSDHNDVELETNHKEKTEKHTKTWKLKNKLLNNYWLNNEIKKGIKRYLETNEYENITTQNLGDTANAVQFIIAGLPQGTRKNSNNLTLHLKKTTKRTTNKLPAKMEA